MNPTKTFHCFILLLFLGANTSISFAQSCLPEGVILYTQQEIDNFANQYPGCTEIEGELKIGDYIYNEINNFNGLNHLTSIGGLRIEGCNDLIKLEGFSSLETIFGVLIIQYNNILKSLDGLESLHYVSDEILISGNNNLENLNGFFKRMNTIQNSLTIQFNNNLEDLSELAFIHKIKGNLSIVENNSLKNLEGLSSLEKVNGKLTVSQNGGLITLKGLDKLQFINNDLFIYYNTQLTSLNGLSKLSTIKGDFNISLNNLNNLEGLESLNEITSDLIIDYNSNLTSLNGLEGLGFVGSDIVISRNESLNDLSGFACFNTVGTESLIIHDNDNLVSLEGLKDMNLRNLSLISITENNILKTCAIESLCQYISDGKTIDLVNNAPECNDFTSISNTCEDIPIKEYNCEGFPFPNPTNDFLMLTCDCDHLNRIKYKIFDTIGRQMASGIFSHQAIDISHLGSGSYFIKFEDGKEIDLTFSFEKM